MSEEAPTTPEPSEARPLSQAAQYLLEACRMVLPGLQVLFGFPLIAVFNPRFAQQLSPAEQCLHLLAIALATVALAPIMTPAADHRQTGPRQVSETFLHLSTRVRLWSMGPLAVSLCVDLDAVGRVMVDGVAVPLLAAALFAVFITLWFLLPRLRALQRAVHWRT